MKGKLQCMVLKKLFLKEKGQWDQTEHTLRCLIKLTVSTVWDFTEQILCKSCLFYTEEERKPKLHIKSQYLYFCEYKFYTTISSIVS